MGEEPLQGGEFQVEEVDMLLRYGCLTVGEATTCIQGRGLVIGRHAGITPR